MAAKYSEDSVLGELSSQSQVSRPTPTVDGHSQQSLSYTTCIGPCQTKYKESNRQVDMLECSVCDGWMCFKCLSFNKTEKKMLSKPEIQWKCPSCVKNKMPMQAQSENSLARLVSIESKLDKAILIMADKLEQKADRQEVQSLQTQLSSVQSDVEQLKKSTHVADMGVDSCLGELEAREERKLNVIIDVGESDSADGNIRKKEDTEHVHAILAQIEVTPVVITDCRRLGPYRRELAAGKPRPLRITTESAAQKGAILKSAHHLKEFDGTKSIIIRKDLTPLQREQEKNLMKEWQKRKEESVLKGDLSAKWIRRSGKVVNIGKRTTAPRQAPSTTTMSPQTSQGRKETPVPDLGSHQDFPVIGK